MAFGIPQELAGDSSVRIVAKTNWIQKTDTHPLNFYLMEHLSPMNLLLEEWAASFPTSAAGKLMEPCLGAGLCLWCWLGDRNPPWLSPAPPGRAESGFLGHSRWVAVPPPKVKFCEKQLSRSREKGSVLTCWCAALANRALWLIAYGYFAQRSPKPRAQITNSSQLQSPQER